MRRISGQRAFEATLALLSLMGRNGRRLLGTGRLQWQMLWLVCAALVAGTLPLWARGLPIGDRVQLPLSPAFALLWLLGAVCAVAAAWQAKYHRLAALALAAALNMTPLTVSIPVVVAAAFLLLRISAIRHRIARISGTPTTDTTSRIISQKLKAAPP